MSRRIKTAIVLVILATTALGVSLGAKAMPMSEAQSGCTGGGGDWYSWVDFYEDDDGTLVGYTVSVCITPMDGYDAIRAWLDEYDLDNCFHAWNGGGTNCKSPYWDQVEKSAPSPTPTPGPTSTTSGTTSGTYQQPTTTSAPRTTTGTTSGTNSR